MNSNSQKVVVLLNPLPNRPRLQLIHVPERPHEPAMQKGGLIRSGPNCKVTRKPD